jgi:hypothetical protein
VFIDDDSKCKTDYDNPYKSITDNKNIEAGRSRSEEEARRLPKLNTTRFSWAVRNTRLYLLLKYS